MKNMQVCIRLTGIFFTCSLLMACKSNTNDPLKFSEDQYKEACLVTRDGGKPSLEHIKYLRYEPSLTEHEGLFFISVYNPLGAVQIECASIVFNGDGEQTASAMKPMSQMKVNLDNSARIMLTGYTRYPNEDKSRHSVHVNLRRSSGGALNYDINRSHTISPIDKSCIDVGCGFIYNEFVDLKINEIDAPLFVGGGRVNLQIKSLSQPTMSFDFDVPSK